MNRHRQTGSMHPLMAVALTSVIVASGAIVAKQAGWIGSPSTSSATTLSPATATPPVTPAVAAATPPAPAASPAPSTPSEQRPVAHHHHSRPHQMAQYEPPAAGYAPPPPSSAPACPTCGVVTDVSTAVVQGKDTGLGAVGGAIAGGVLGHQVGGGNGNKVATVLGALGGALAGNQIEERARSQTVYRVQVQLNDGSSRTVTFPQAPGFSVGQHVRLEGDTLLAN